MKFMALLVAIACILAMFMVSVTDFIGVSHQNVKSSVSKDTPCALMRQIQYPIVAGESNSVLQYEHGLCLVAQLFVDSVWNPVEIEKPAVFCPGYVSFYWISPMPRHPDLKEKAFLLDK
uniref:Secreted protein n=1 Tax=Bursaphelenchus xylophilus TaxID=6326 RepID=A0A1I7SL35_BURXY